MIFCLLIPLHFIVILGNISTSVFKGTTPAAHFSTSFVSVADTGGKFATGVNDTNGKFSAGVNDTGGK